MPEDFNQTQTIMSQKDPFNALFKPENIVNRSLMTLSEANPELEKIADANGLTLKNDWLKVLRIYDQGKLKLRS